MITKNEINEYIKNIRKQLLYGTKESKLFLKELKQNILDFADENKNTDIADIRSRFGTEEEVANAFLENIDIKAVKKKITIKRLIAVLVVAIIAIWGIGAIITTIQANNATGSYSVHYELKEETPALKDAENLTSLAE